MTWWNVLLLVQDAKEECVKLETAPLISALFQALTKHVKSTNANSNKKHFFNQRIRITI